MMTVGMWFTGDLANLINGLHQSTEFMRGTEFREGYNAALWSMSVALGVATPQSVPVLYAAKLQEIEGRR